jgi:hypothetical protein
MLNIFNKPVELFISKKKYEKKLSDFAYNVSKTTNYNDCGQTNFKLKVYQHFIGKLIELGLFLYLTSENISINEPDFNIYNGKEKSWASDAVIDNYFRVSVKGQDVSSAHRFGLSWTFQDIPGGRSDVMLAEHDDSKIIIPGLYDNLQIYQTNNFNCYYLILFPPLHLNNIKWGKPLKKSLVGTKRILYACDNYPDLNQWTKLYNLNLDKDIEEVWVEKDGKFIKKYKFV